MQRPQSLDFHGSIKTNTAFVMPVILSYEFKSPDKPTQTRLWRQSTDSRGPADSGKAAGRPGTRAVPLDQQVSQLSRQFLQTRLASAQRVVPTGLPSSQSFCQSVYASPVSTASTTNSISTRSRVPPPVDCCHSSRIVSTAYMSPPPSDWSSVGNIIPVKRSTSMPGYRGVGTGLNKTATTNKTLHQISTKKKSGAFQCLKHQFKKSSLKSDVSSYSISDDIDDNNNESNSYRKSVSKCHKSPSISVIMSTSAQFPKEHSEKVKTSRSIFKKKSSPSNNLPSFNSKSKGIKKSISLFFSSKSYRTVKSDPSILDQTTEAHPKEPTPTIIRQNERQYSFKSAARLNHSYESMLHRDEKVSSLSLYTDANRRNSCTSVEDNSSVYYDHAVEPTEERDRVRTPSETSLTDTVSLSSSGNHIFAYSSFNQYNSDQYSIAATSCRGNINYRASDNCWKTVVGNVCRSNSKDSAIANSTLSADGMINQSKRMSQISTVSRTSDITQTSEDFNDSSYSSFNDLQTHGSQIYNVKKKRTKPILPKFPPIELELKQEFPNNYDSSPLSDSSTETLRPLSCLLRRKFLSTDKSRKPYHSNTTIRQTKFLESNNILKSFPLRHVHSWPSCNVHSLCLPVTNTKPCTKHSVLQKKPTNTLMTNKMEHPKIKFDKLHLSRINNSPLLSQYSRLYSLKTAGVQQKFGLSNFSGHQTSSIEPPLSPIKYSSRTYQHFP